MNKKLAWDTFKQTGSINSYLEFKEVKNKELCIYEKNEPAVILSAKSKKATFLCLSGVCCLCNTC